MQQALFEAPVGHFPRILWSSSLLKTRLNRIREINEIDPKKQQVFKSINYQIPKKLKNQGRDSGLINISEKQNEVLSEGEVVSNDSSFRYM